MIVLSLSGTCGPAASRRSPMISKRTSRPCPACWRWNVTGGLEREIRIEVDTDKLAYYRIPITAFQPVVPSENQNTSGGAITLGQGRYQLRVPGEFQTPEEILGLVVATHEGQPIYLKDVATVVDGVKDETSRSRLDGIDSVNIAVKKRVRGKHHRDHRRDRPGHRARQPYLAPGHPHHQADGPLQRDPSHGGGPGEQHHLSGLLLVVVVLLFALGLRNAILVGLAIPFSMFALLFRSPGPWHHPEHGGAVFPDPGPGHAGGQRHRHRGEHLPVHGAGGAQVQAAMKATGEVAWPVIGSTMTTLAAFFPMVFWPGIMGEFMKYLPITLIVTLSSSLFVAMVVNPALCAIFMKVKGDGPPCGTGVSADDIAEGGEQPIQIDGPILRDLCTAYAERGPGPQARRAVAWPVAESWCC
jgi:multidrug efflux pump